MRSTQSSCVGLWKLKTPSSRKSRLPKRYQTDGLHSMAKKKFGFPYITHQKLRRPRTPPRDVLPPLREPHPESETVSSTSSSRLSSVKNYIVLRRTQVSGSESEVYCPHCPQVSGSESEIRSPGHREIKATNDITDGKAKMRDMPTTRSL